MKERSRQKLSRGHRISFARGFMSETAFRPPETPPGKPEGNKLSSEQRGLCLGSWVPGSSRCAGMGRANVPAPPRTVSPPLPLDWAAHAWLWVGMMYPALQPGSEGSGAQLAAQMGHLVRIFKITPKASDSQHRSLRWDR